MPRKSGCIPAYSLHRSSGQAIVRIAGHDHYLGLHGSPESREKYDRLIAEWLSQGRQPIAVTVTPECGLLIHELLLKFVDHAERYYLFEGEISKEVVNCDGPVMVDSGGVRITPLVPGRVRLRIGRVRGIRASGVAARDCKTIRCRETRSVERLPDCCTFDGWSTRA